MEAMRTGMRISGIVAIGLLCSAAAQAQNVVPMSGCLGVGCVPTSNLIALMGTNLIPWWSSVGIPKAASTFSIRRENDNAQGNQDAQGDQDEDGPRKIRNAQGDQGDDDGHAKLQLGGSTAAYTGMAFTLFVWFMRPADETHTDGFAAFGGEAGGTTVSGVSAPLSAHLEFAQTSAVVASPEPATLALAGSGLFALGGGVLLRRRRRR